MGDINLDAVQPTVCVSGLGGVPHRDEGERLAGKEGYRFDAERHGTAGRENVDDALHRRAAGRSEVAQQ